jgi:hypothetical protein
LKNQLQEAKIIEQVLRKRPNDQEQNYEKSEAEIVLLRNTIPKRYQQLFLGYCFFCHNFGHKELDCKGYRKNYHKIVQGYGHRNNTSISNQRSRNYNSFSPLQDYNIEFYKCNNYGHKTSNFILEKYSMQTSISISQEEKYKKIWKDNEIEEKETKCKVSLYFKNNESNGSLRVDAQII